MSTKTVTVTIEHPGSHTADPETFRQSLAQRFAKEAKEAGARRVAGSELTISSRFSQSGSHTDYEVSGDVEPVEPEPKPEPKK